MGLNIDLRTEENEKANGLLDGLKVSHVRLFQLLLVDDDEGEKREIDLPEVHFVLTEKEESPGPHGPDRAKIWKKASEWMVDLVISDHPKVEEEKYQNRVEAEKRYLYGDEEPDYYQWQDDEETLKGIRPTYKDLKQGLIEEVGRPRRKDFDELYPHEYDDPGLSERARRAVRDMKAVFGDGVLVDAG